MGDALMAFPSKSDGKSFLPGIKTQSPIIFKKCDCGGERHSYCRDQAQFGEFGASSPFNQLGRGRRGSVDTHSTHPVSTTAQTTRNKGGSREEKAQLVGFLYVAPLTPDVEDEPHNESFVAPCATLDLSAVQNDADCLANVLETTKKKIELYVRPLTDNMFKVLGEAGA